MRLCSQDLLMLDVQAYEYYLEWSGIGYVVAHAGLAGIPSTNNAAG